MSRIVRISESDYRLKVKDLGTITLDVGNAPGKVVITGDLQVLGDTTTVDTTNLTIEDNIILLNKGETGAGVTEVTSGLEIDRGSLANSQLLWDESIDKFTTQLDTGTLVGVKADSYAGDPTSNLKFDMQGGAGVLRITNSTDYELRVLNDDDIPNKKYISDYVSAVGGVATVNRIFSPISATSGNEDTVAIANPSNIRFFVRSGGNLNLRAQVTAQGVDVDNINIYVDTIYNKGASNLVLTAVNNQVEINGVLNLDQQVSDPSVVNTASRLYSKTVTSNYELFNSGVFVVNSRTSDELVVKNRALLLSMLF